MYHCTKCGGSMSYPHDKCPHCGVWLTGVRCNNCYYTGSKTEFISNNHRCPKCGTRVIIPYSTSSPTLTNSNPSDSTDAFIGYCLIFIVIIGILALIFG